MQPGHIRVFDGLRVSTEHIDHFQGSLHSAIGDVRRILGTGRVHRGFAVEHAGASQIVVQPGLAFDFLGNRVVGDDAITLDVPPLSGGGPAYVCVSYAQVEDGIVEGHATLVYDSCAADIRATAPAPLDNAIVIATLVPPAAGSTNRFEIVTPAPALTAGSPRLPASDLAPNAVPKTAPSTLRVHQDVLHLAPDDASHGALAVLLGAMKRFADAKAGPAPSATLATAVVPVGFPVTSVSCHAALDATLTGDAPIQFRGMSHGDATLDKSAVAQQCASRVEVVSGADASRWRGRLGVSQSFIAALPMAIDSGAKDSADPPVPLDVLHGLVLAIALGRPTDEGMTVSCSLVWDGDVSDNVLQWFAQRTPVFDWNVSIAWKATGTMAGGAAIANGQPK